MTCPTINEKQHWYNQQQKIFSCKVYRERIHLETTGKPRIGHPPLGGIACHYRIFYVIFDAIPQYFQTKIEQPVLSAQFSNVKLSGPKNERYRAFIDFIAAPRCWPATRWTLSEPRRGAGPARVSGRPGSTSAGAPVPADSLNAGWVAARAGLFAHSK